MTIILGNLLAAVGAILGTIITLVIWLLIARAILSWVNPDPSNMIVKFITDSTEPILVRVREKIPPIGMFDLSLLFVILGLYFIEIFLVGSINSYSTILLHSAGVAPAPSSGVGF